jgi:hypothetical protein
MLMVSEISNGDRVDSDVMGGSPSEPWCTLQVEEKLLLQIICKVSSNVHAERE